MGFGCGFWEEKWRKREVGDMKLGMEMHWRGKVGDFEVKLGIDCCDR